MVIHAIIRIGHPEGVIDRKSFFSDFQYVVGGYPYSLTTIENGILRNNRRGRYSLVKPFGSTDKRLEVCVLSCLHTFRVMLNISNLSLKFSNASVGFGYKYINISIY